MPLEAGMSFLNVGSGTGYFNSIVSELVGDQATNHGVDIWPETVAHAEHRCRLLGKHTIEFMVGNVYQLNVNNTTRYDRIYLGACANSKSKYLYRLLEVGGILIGPFQVGHTQQLRRVVRQTETQFSVEILGSVQFASLVEPSPTLPPAPQLGRTTLVGTAIAEGISVEAVGNQCAGLPHVPFTFSLNERPWTPERCRLYPTSFRQTVSMGLLCKPRDPRLPCLPAEIWVKHIFPWCPRWWFEASRGQRPNKGDDESDDGASTRAPSSAPSSAPSPGTTPDSGPTRPPPEMAAAVGAMESALPPRALPPRTPDVLFEVFGNGQRHAIGVDEDPDDVEPDEGPRMVVPSRVLQLLAADTRRLRRNRAEMEQNEDVDVDADEEDGDASDQDDEMLNPDENELDVDDNYDASDVAML